MNPFTPLYQACNTGDSAEKYASLAEFPRIIDVEVTNACNFRCLFCPTGNHAMTRPSGFMAIDVACRLVEEASRHGASLRFIGWGEPLMHPCIVDFIGHAADKGVLTHINTNGSKLTLNMAADLCNAGLDSIKFSFQGVDRETYKEARNIDFYDGLYEAVKMMRFVRDDRAYPYIQVSTTTTYETPEQIEAFKARFAPICDQVTVGRTVFAHLDMKAVRLRKHEKATLEKLAQYEPDNLAHPSPCPEVYDKLTVQWDGSVRVCCNDFDGVTNLGNIMERPLKEIWRDKTIEDYRKRLAQKDYGGPLCSGCYDYMGVTA
jgi:radical SAM protein with 4Fe4S-binding SPASM domain